jgi:hypothetical protein
MSIEEKDKKDKTGLRLGPEPDPESPTSTEPNPFLGADLDKVRILSLDPGDALVIYLKDAISAAGLERLRANMEDWTIKAFGRKVHVCVLERGASLEVLRAGEETPK